MIALLLFLVHDSLAVNTDVEANLQNTFLQLAMIKSIGFAYEALPAIQVAELAFNTGLWPFIYNAKIKNLRNTTKMDYTKEAQQFEVLTASKLLKVKLRMLFISTY